MEHLSALKIVKVFFWSSALKDKAFFTVTQTDKTWPPQGKRKEFLEKNKYLIKELLTQELEKFIIITRNSGAIPVLMLYHRWNLDFVRQAYEETAKKENVLLIDQEKYFNSLWVDGIKVNNLVLHADHWHPNKQGYEYMAKYIAEQLKANKIIP